MTPKSYSNPPGKTNLFVKRGQAYADVAEAIIYAADHRAKVINLSLGGPSYSVTLLNAVNYGWNRGAVITAAAGDNASNAPVCPAALNNVLAVTATDGSDKLAYFSSFGSCRLRRNCSYGRPRNNLDLLARHDFRPTSRLPASLFRASP